MLAVNLFTQTLESGKAYSKVSLLSTVFMAHLAQWLHDKTHCVQQFEYVIIITHIGEKQSLEMV